MKDTIEDKKSSMDLRMAPVSEEPAKRYYAAHPNLKKKRFPAVKRLIKQGAVLVAVALLSIGSYYAISHYFVETVEVVGKSMTPTLHENGHYILNRWVFHTREPRRGDVVVLRDPEDHGISVKRVIAVEGESVHFVDGHVYVNGHELNEPYVYPPALTFTYHLAKEQIIMCGKNQYFVMGDNRVASVDSRSYGPVAGANIMGLLVVR